MQAPCCQGLQVSQRGVTEVPEHDRRLAPYQGIESYLAPRLRSIHPPAVDMI